ncbi:ASCH domain-containing protein [Thalassoglobus polymorphus]|uniref:ASCH domain-containing protein n=1 Tax=Thalassoglobus polymorphus TaxID=2527994 RepID=A0A517QS27_9PLAN|nr:ASCH domain-containing protein [Thalassoglobus polymorphus]QDT34419.1 hypothetical protein Mal48_36790 [Thalassoglobus polymorphus]
MQHPIQDRIALGVQQPWAELILQGIKTVEVRNVPVGMRTTVYLYSSRKRSKFPDADVAVKSNGIDLQTLAYGRIVGSVDIVDCQPCSPEDAVSACVSWELMQGRYSWKLENPVRCPLPIEPRYIPYGMWFYPFKPRVITSRDRRNKLS